jgi:hypothetical protein
MQLQKLQHAVGRLAGRSDTATDQTPVAIPTGAMKLRPHDAEYSEAARRAGVSHQ